MFIGNLVKLKEELIRTDNKDVEFSRMAIEEGWIWLVTGMDDEDLDYTIKPLYLDDESNITQLGGELLVLHDEIEAVNFTREELFMELRRQIKV